MSAYPRLSAAFAVTLLAANPPALLACAACFGKSDDLMAQGMNMGIFTLLVVISLVLIGIASVGVFFARRTARLQAGTASPTSTPLSVPQSNQ